jgi:transposase
MSDLIVKMGQKADGQTLPGSQSAHEIVEAIQPHVLLWLPNGMPVMSDGSIRGMADNQLQQPKKPLILLPGGSLWLSEKKQVGQDKTVAVHRAEVRHPQLSGLLPSLPCPPSRLPEDPLHLDTGPEFPLVAVTGYEKTECMGEESVFDVGKVTAGGLDRTECVQAESELLRGEVEAGSLGSRECGQIDLELTKNHVMYQNNIRENSERLLDDNHNVSYPLPGFIGYNVKKSGIYAKYISNTYVKDGKVYHTSEYLGKVEDKEKGIYRSRQRGVFSFSLDHGFQNTSPENYPSISTSSRIPVASLDFGDIWMIDHIINQLGLDKVIEDIIPEKSDTLKSLIAYELIKQSAYQHASDWYNNSYAKILYPHANVDSPRISELHAKLGSEEIKIQFFQSYLKHVFKIHADNKDVPFAVVIDSSGFENDIKTFLTAVNNHGGIISNEFRITYVIDKNSGIPLFCEITPGNIIDNSLLISTVNFLNSFNIEVDIIIMDAGYFSKNNILQLINANINFLTRMPDNRKDYKHLISEYGFDIQQGENAVIYGERKLFVKRVEIMFEGHKLFAYVMNDIDGECIAKKNAIAQYKNDKDKIIKINNAIAKAGKFILLSSKAYNNDEILPLYYTRQIVEQIIDVIKNNAGGIPVRGHTVETIKGITITAFISGVIYLSLNKRLSDSKFSANTAIIKMGNLNLICKDNKLQLQELTSDQKQIFKTLNLPDPFSVECGNLIEHSTPLLFDTTIRKRGRPKGKKTITDSNPSITPLPSDETRPKRGRPKGSKNLSQTNLSTLSAPSSEGQRKRGRPKGSKNKPKVIHSPQLPQSAGEQRKRGRPKGSKNRRK